MGLLAIAQAILLVLLLLNLLKSPVTIAEAPVTLSFAVPPLEVQRNNWKALIQDFQSKNPDIHIKVVPGSDVTDAFKATYTTEFKNAEAKQTCQNSGREFEEKVEKL